MHTWQKRTASWAFRRGAWLGIPLGLVVMELFFLNTPGSQTQANPLTIALVTLLLAFATPITPALLATVHMKEREAGLDLGSMLGVISAVTALVTALLIFLLSAIAPSLNPLQAFWRPGSSGGGYNSGFLFIIYFVPLNIASIFLTMIGGSLGGRFGSWRLRWLHSRASRV